MTDSPTGPVHQPGTRPWRSTRPSHPIAEPPRLPIFRPEQPAPIDDGVKDLRPLTRAPYRALLDPAAYLDAPNKQADDLRTKDQVQDPGVERPRRAATRSRRCPRRVLRARVERPRPRPSAPTGSLAW